jgi:hypothetical protein
VNATPRADNLCTSCSDSRPTVRPEQSRLTPFDTNQVRVSHLEAEVLEAAEVSRSEPPAPNLTRVGSTPRKPPTSVGRRLPLGTYPERRVRSVVIEVRGGKTPTG